MALMQRAESCFRPAPWLANCHAQTLWPALLRRPSPLPWQASPLELPDGDVLELCYGPPAPGALVLLLHGLGGSVESGYIGGLGRSLWHAGMQPVVMHYRGVGMTNRCDRFYHAGAAEDVAAAVAHLRARWPTRRVAVVGFSLGASMLLNWLAWQGDQAEADAAVAVSVPFELGACADALEQGFRRLYQWDLVRGLKRLVRRKYAAHPAPPVEAGALRRIRTLRQFDDAVTAPLHGFADAADYYRRCSCRQRLSRITRPTLILHAADDPFVPLATVPAGDELPAAVSLELSRAGGHVGFVESRGYWLERRIPQWLRRVAADDPPSARAAQPATEGQGAGDGPA